MKTRTGYDNVEMKQFILDRLAQVEYTDTYVFAIRHQGMIKAAKVEHAMDILPLVSYCEKQASSHGAPWGVRMWNSSAAFEIILSYASEVWTLCSVDEFEESYQAAGGKKAIPGYRGEWFERMFVEYVGGTRPESRTAKCTECGDVILNGEHLQLKLWNATVTTEPQVNRFYAQKLHAEA